MQLLCCLVLLSTLLAIASAFGKAPFPADVIGHHFGLFKGNSPGEPCAQKAMSGVRQCLKQYYSIYGYDIDHMPKAKMFASKLQYIEMAKEKEGVQYVCENMDALTACLASVEGASTCNNVASYMAMLGTDKRNADDYLNSWIFGNIPLEIACANEKAYEDSYECMLYMDGDFVYNEMYCLALGTVETWFGVDNCTVSADMVSCISSLYAEREDCGQEAAKFFCKAMEALVVLEEPECKSKILDCERPFATFDVATIKKKLQIPRRRLTSLTDALRYDVY